MKIYEVYIQDEWNKNYLVGFFHSLKEALPNVNAFLKAYEVQISQEDLVEYSSSLGTCFDKCLCDIFKDNEEVAGLVIRGFIFDKNALLKEIK